MTQSNATPAFTTMDAFRALLIDQPQLDAAAQAEAADHNGQLTKPPGSLGRLEDLAIWYRGWRGGARAQIETPQVIVFAGNHGVAARGVEKAPWRVGASFIGASIIRYQRHVLPHLPRCMGGWCVGCASIPRRSRAAQTGEGVGAKGALRRRHAQKASL